MNYVTSYSFALTDDDAKATAVALNFTSVCWMKRLYKGLFLIVYNFYCAFAKTWLNHSSTYSSPVRL